MGRGKFTNEMADELTRLMACLVSSERQDVLFERISEGDPDDLEELRNLTFSAAEQGINWWMENNAVLDSICQRFADSLIATARGLAVSTATFLPSNHY